MHGSIPVLLVALLFLAILLFRSTRAPKITAYNVGEGFWPGKKSYISDVVVSSRYLLGKIGTGPSNIAIAGAADKPIGIITDEAAVGDIIDVDFLGSARETKIMVASAAIAAGDFLMPAANGQVATLSASAGTYYVVGRALKAAAAAGDLIEVDPIPCVKTVV